MQDLGYLLIRHTIYTYNSWITGSFMSPMHIDSSTSYSYDTMSPIYYITVHSNSIMYIMLYVVDMSNGLSLAMDL